MKVLIELDSNDIKIGAVNNVLDLARYSKDFELEYFLAGPLNKELSNVASACGMKLIALQSLQISKRPYMSYIFLLYFFFEWKGEYSVHIKQIDNEHKKIIIHRIKSQQSIM